MAEFFAETLNIGVGDIVQHEVTIFMSDCSVDENGRHFVIPECVTIEELDYHVELAIKSLRKAQEIARGYLEENQGINEDDEN